MVPGLSMKTTPPGSPGRGQSWGRTMASVATKRRTYPSPEPEWVGLYAVANSAGLVSPHIDRYLTHEQAKHAARMESMAGWNGECWPVRLIEPTDTITPREATILDRIAADAGIESERGA